MCVFKKDIDNPRFKGDKKVFCSDKRKLKIGIDCGVCTECRNRRATDWRQRLMEEKNHNSSNMWFVTMTFSDEELYKFEQYNKALGIYSEGYDLEKWITKLAVKRFRERWRKKFKKSPRYWFITEKGSDDKFSERLHLHGFIWHDFEESLMEYYLNDRWQYGRISVDGKAKEGSVIYCTDYMSKFNKLHPNFKPLVRCSHGIGRDYITEQKKREHWQNGDFVGTYKFRNGKKVALCKYYKHKLTTEEQRSKIWTKALNENKKYLRGQEYNCNDIVQLRRYEKHLMFVQDQELKSGVRPHEKVERNVKLKRILERQALKYDEECKTWKKKWDNLNLGKSTWNEEQYLEQLMSYTEREQKRQIAYLKNLKSIAEKQMKGSPSL